MFLMPKERHMRGGGRPSSRTRMCYCAPNPQVVSGTASNSSPPCERRRNGGAGGGATTPVARGGVRFRSAGPRRRSSNRSSTRSSWSAPCILQLQQGAGAMSWRSVFCSVFPRFLIKRTKHVTKRTVLWVFLAFWQVFNSLLVLAGSWAKATRRARVCG